MITRSNAGAQIYRRVLRDSGVGFGMQATILPSNRRHPMTTSGKTASVVLAVLFSGVFPALGVDRPNMIYILADDLGYGDVQVLNPTRGRIKTPSLDKLAAQGMAFTDAHSGSSVCTPTRYGIMTGRYSWRTSLVKGVLGGVSPPLIAPDRLTVARMLKDQGYHTACIGKWHLGFNWAKWENPGQQKKHPGWQFDFSKPIERGPVSAGFDSFFGISASLDMAPFAWIENDRVTALPTAEKKWVRKGPAAPEFEAVDVLPTLTRKAIETIETQSKSGKPFFIYLPLASPHTPIVPSPEWHGKSGLGSYADFVMQTDSCVGELVAALEKNGVADNTLVIFTSDNGCSPAAEIGELEKQGHYPSADFRGHKADIWEGGHRVPFIVRWPAKVKPGGKSDALVCLTDFMATAAEITGVKLPDTAAEDSFSLLPVLLGSSKSARTSLVNHSISGQFAVREGSWKLAFCAGSGGWSKPGDGDARKQGLPAVQLVDLSGDIGETNNRQEAQPEVVARLTRLMEGIASNGRSTPGAPQKNDTAVDFRKSKP
jgi:arylsulfatase A